MELQKAIIIKNTPAKIEVNFDEVRALLEKEMERYQYVVTAETVGDAKKMATELNKLKKTIAELRKSEIRKASVDIDEFDEGMKDLEITAEKYRKDLMDQAARFEDETRELCRNLLSKLRDSLFDEHQVEAKFHRAEIEDLVKISNVTDKGNLTKSVKQTLESRVRDDKALQDKIARRALELENQCYKAGLEAPLTQEHVKAFLFADDETYQRELQSLIAKELERQQETERRLRVQMEKEQERKQQEEQARVAREAKAKEAEEAAQAQEVAQAEVEKPEPEPSTAPPRHFGYESSGGYTEPSPQPETSRPAPAKGKVVFHVTSEFRIEAPAGLTEKDIDAEFRRIIAKAGAAKSLVAVYVKKSEANSAGEAA